MKYYEKAVTVEPKNTTFWENLYVVYDHLSLDKKAKKAAQKAGIN